MASPMRWAIAVGIVLIAWAVAVAVWPLHANGVSGSALWPDYAKAFGFTTYQPLPANPTLGELRRAGVLLPQDAVAHRRHLAELLAVVGLIAICVGLAMRRFRRPLPD